MNFNCNFSDKYKLFESSGIKDMNIKMPVIKINELIKKDKVYGERIDFEILNLCGFFIIRNYFSSNLIEKYRKIYFDYKFSKSFDRTKGHLTEVVFGLDHQLTKIIYEEEFTNFVAQFFNGNVGLYNIRIVKKDKDDILPVFLHQDICYQYGSFNRYSIFVPLTECNQENGGLTFLPGSHKFGYLGDAGEISDILPAELIRITPSVKPTDLIVMDSCLWHKSGRNSTLNDRIYYDIHINNANDTASKVVISGKRDEEWQFNYDQEIIFKNSRNQRLRKLYSELGKGK